MLYLNLSTFFDEQRRRWYDTTLPYPQDYVAGGWAALLQAELIFKRGPLFNAHFATNEMKKELEDVSHKFTSVRKKLGKEETQRDAAKLLLKEAHRISQDDQHRAARTRRALERIANVTTLDEYEPEVRLRYIQELVRQHLAPKPVATPIESVE